MRWRAEANIIPWLFDVGPGFTPPKKPKDKTSLLIWAQCISIESKAEGNLPKRVGRWGPSSGSGTEEGLQRMVPKKAGGQERKSLETIRVEGASRMSTHFHFCALETPLFA